MGKTTLAISLLVLLSIVIFAQSATAAVHKVVIAVDASGTPTVDSDRATLSVNNGDTVVWVPSQGISGFSVVFDSGSPFSRSSFTSTGGRISSGRITSTNSATYKYSVWVNGKWLDPQIIVSGGGG